MDVRAIRLPCAPYAYTSDLDVMPIRRSTHIGQPLTRLSILGLIHSPYGYALKLREASTRRRSNRSRKERPLRGRMGWGVYKAWHVQSPNSKLRVLENFAQHVENKPHYRSLGSFCSCSGKPALSPRKVWPLFPSMLIKLFVLTAQYITDRRIEVRGGRTDTIFLRAYQKSPPTENQFL